MIKDFLASTGHSVSNGALTKAMKRKWFQEKYEILPAVLSVMRHIYENIMYAELNTKSDYCQVCGYSGEIGIVEDDGKLLWECPEGKLYEGYGYTGKQ